METTLKELTTRLRDGNGLELEAIDTAVSALAAEEVDPMIKGGFLTALHEKGETAEEIAGFAESFLKRARDPGVQIGKLAEEAIDFVGTGGDRSGAFNISTTVSFILASAGVRVLKHGNRGATSLTGSADLLEVVGYPLETDPGFIEDALENLNFAYLFARAYHPAFKAIVPVRMALAEKGIRTVFNLLGPLINPGRPRHQVMGVYAEDLVEPIAGALQDLGIRRGLVVHGRIAGGKALDKFTTAGRSHVRGVGELEDLVATWMPDDFGLEQCRLADLQGGDAEANLALLNDFLEGRANPGLTGTLYLNAGAGFWVMNRTDSLEEGIEMAREQVESGRTKAWLEKARAYFEEASSGG